MKTKKKLLIIGPHYDTFIKGSGEELANYYDEINVIIPKWKKLKLFFFKKTIFKIVDKKFSTSKKNIKIHEVLCSSIIFFATKDIINYLNHKKIDYNLILSHFLVPYGYLGNQLASLNCVKSIIIGHGFDVYKFPFDNFINKNIAQKILKESDKIITVSNSNLKCLRKLGYKNKVNVIPNGFDPKVFKKLDKNKCKSYLNIPKNKKVILTIGNLVDVKNQISLINAIKELKIKKQNFICYIIGNGSLKQALEDKIKQEKLGGYIKLKGSKPHKEIPLWLNAADVFVLPSYSEGNPTVMFEALGCGIPYVGTNVGGVRDIIHSEKYGFIYDNPKDYKTFANLLDKSLNKKWDKNEILNYSKRFTWNKIVQELLKKLNKY